MQSAVAWDRLYARRRVKLYPLENKRLGDIDGRFFDLSHLDANADESSILISKFLNAHRSNVDPPADLLYSRLREYLQFTLLGPLHTKSVLVDERCDSTGGLTSTRLWDSESGNPSQHGYMDYPPKGDPIFTKALTIAELKQRLMETAKTFNLEFHIPFFALRKASSAIHLSRDNRTLSGEPFRKSRLLPLCNDDGEETYLYHEAQISFMVTGIDEWMWTAYCLVDTYFGNELDWETYLENNKDPSTAGVKALDFPIWNPRNYFLVALDQRMTQATREWTSLINKFEECMILYEERRREFRDDPDLTHTEKLTLATSTIRRFRDAASSTIDAWQNFEDAQIQHLETSGNEALRERWDEYLANVRRNVSEMKSMRALLARKLEQFNSIRDGVGGNPAMRCENPAKSISSSMLLR